MSVSWDVMAYRRPMHNHLRQRSFAYRLGFAIGATATRIILWPLLLLGDDDE